MTWIFAEDFEGCNGTSLINLRAIPIIIKSDYLIENTIYFGEYRWSFDTSEQAQAAYEKIKGMLKPYEAPF